MRLILARRFCTRKKIFDLRRRLFKNFVSTVIRRDLGDDGEGRYSSSETVCDVHIILSCSQTKSMPVDNKCRVLWTVKQTLRKFRM